MAPKHSRLYAKGVFTGFKRGLRNQSCNTTLVKIEGCADKADASFYVGKRCAFVYKAKKKTTVPNSDRKSKTRVIWGKVTRTHGHAGSVRAKFRKNMNPEKMGCRIRIMLYPSNI